MARVEILGYVDVSLRAARFGERKEPGHNGSRNIPGALRVPAVARGVSDMCYFIACAVPDSHGPAVKRLVGFSASKCGNRSVHRVFDVAVAAYWIMDGMCACGLFQTPRDRVAQDIEARAEKIRRKYRLPRYRKRGWTEEKIEEAVTELRERHRRGARGEDDEIHIGLSRVLAKDFGDLAREAGWAAFLVHWFRGDVNDEDLSAFPVEPVSPDALAADPAIAGEDTWLYISTE